MTSIILQSHLPGQVEVEFQSPGCKLMLLCPRPRSDPLNQNFLVGQYPIFWQFHPFAYFSLHFMLISMCYWSLCWNYQSLLLAFWIHEWMDAVSKRKVLILGLVLAYCRLSCVGTSHCMVLVSPFSFVHRKKSTQWPQTVIQFWCSVTVCIFIAFPSKDRLFKCRSVC